MAVMGLLSYSWQCSLAQVEQASETSGSRELMYVK